MKACPEDIVAELCEGMVVLRNKVGPRKKRGNVACDASGVVKLFGQKSAECIGRVECGEHEVVVG